MIIKDICEFYPKSKIKAGEGLEYGAYPFYTSSSILSKYLNSYEIEKDGIILGTGGSASIHYCEGKFSASTDCLVMYSKDDRINTEYLYYYLLCNIHILEHGFRGAGLKHISKKYIEDIEIKYIPELSIQKKIIEVIKLSRKLIDKRKEQIEALDKLVKSRFIEMFGDPFYNKYKWSIKLFDEVFDISSSSRILKSEWISEGIPFYRVRDMVKLSDHGNADNEFFISEELYLSLSKSKGVPEAGDIMVSATSTIGKCYIVKENERFYYKDADVLQFRKKIDLSPEYFIHFMKTQFAINQIKSTFGITTVPHFTIANAKKIGIPYPPIELQNQFADFVNQVGKLKSQMETGLKELEDNFNSLMQKAFKGELF